MQKPSRKGFTLIELLVVIAIIAILAAILFPVFAKARKRAQQTACLSNLKQISTAFRQYNDDYDGRFMPAAGWNGTGGAFPTGSFVKVLEPYVKSKDVFLCPSAPKKFNAASYNDQGNPAAEDTGWEWDYPAGTHQRSHYGNNIVLSGYNPNTSRWIQPARESQIKSATSVAYIMDARWVDLEGGPGWEGRVGKARFRHQGDYSRTQPNGGGGLNVLFADGHGAFTRAEKVFVYPASADGSFSWVP